MMDSLVARDAQSEIAALSASGLDQATLLERTMRAVARVVPFDAGGWSVTDPGTVLWTGGVMTGLPAEVGAQFFDNELLQPDVNKFTELLKRPRAVGLLSAATGGEQSRSARYRGMYAPHDLAHELRAAFTAGSSCWGTSCLLRAVGRPDFTPDEIAFVEQAGRHVAQGLRATYVLAAAGEAAGAPGVLVIDDDGQIVSQTAEAERWLDAIDARGLTDGQGLPSVVRSVVSRARACTLGGGADGPPSARLRMADGSWLHVHASALGPHWAVVLEPARPPIVLPLVAEAHELTPREREVLGLLLRGRCDKDIATALVVSPHTAREHVRKVLAKFRVRTRAELSALLFHEHYTPWVTAVD